MERIRVKNRTKALAARTIAMTALATLPLAITAPASAQDSESYFLAHAVNSGAPRQLSDKEITYYGSLFRAIEQERWSDVQNLLKERRRGPLHSVALAEFYLAASSPRVEVEQIQDWLKNGSQLPYAAQLIRLGQTRGLENTPLLPQPQSFSSRGSIPKRIRPPTTRDGTLSASVRASILSRITNDDPNGARALLGEVDHDLSPQARAEWRQRVAFSYYIENMDEQALAVAQTVHEGAGPWVAEGEWVAGLASWRLNDCATAGAHFERAAYGAENVELRAAAYYWASRTALRCRQPERNSALLANAASNDQTLYGMLAAEQLGRALPARFSSANFSSDDWRTVQSSDNVRTAIALAEIGRDTLSSKILLHQARIGDASQYPILSRLARALGLPATQLYMAHNAPRGTSADPASYYPAPRWVPVTGWKVDPALAYAHTLQESNFQSTAVSPAKARGLMQITPITVRQHAPRLNMNAGNVDIFDPEVNLAFGQRNLEMLRDTPATSGHLPKIMAAYNAGLTPITRWNTEIRDQGDPLLYMESIPYWETRGYVAIVMRNYWMYERQADAVSPTRLALAANQWPTFPGTEDSTGNGRVYLSTGGE